MAFITRRGTGAWEIRESHSTPDGPRSRTLATFRLLTPEVIEQARERSSKPLNEAELYGTARRVGAPIAQRRSDRAAGELLAELAMGQGPRRALKRILLDALREGEHESTDSARAAAAWVMVSSERRGETLRDLLLLVDSLPRTSRRKRARFPRIESAPV